MIYKKAEKRIDAIMAQLKGRMTHELDISRNLVWRTASTKETYGDVPAGGAQMEEDSRIPVRIRQAMDELLVLLLRGLRRNGKG